MINKHRIIYHIIDFYINITFHCFFRFTVVSPLHFFMFSRPHFLIFSCPDHPIQPT